MEMKFSSARTLSLGLGLLISLLVSEAWAADDKSTVKAVTDMLGVTSDKLQEKLIIASGPN